MTWHPITSLEEIQGRRGLFALNRLGGDDDGTVDMVLMQHPSSSTEFFAIESVCPHSGNNPLDGDSKINPAVRTQVQRDGCTYYRGTSAPGRH